MHVSPDSDRWYGERRSTVRHAAAPRRSGPSRRGPVPCAACVRVRFALRMARGPSGASRVPKRQRAARSRQICASFDVFSNCIQRCEGVTGSPGLLHLAGVQCHHEARLVERRVPEFPALHQRLCPGGARGRGPRRRALGSDLWSEQPIAHGCPMPFANAVAHTHAHR